MTAAAVAGILSTATLPGPAIIGPARRATHTHPAPDR